MERNEHYYGLIATAKSIMRHLETVGTGGHSVTDKEALKAIVRACRVISDDAKTELREKHGVKRVS